MLAPVLASVSDGLDTHHVHLKYAKNADLYTHVSLVYAVLNGGLKRVGVRRSSSITQTLPVALLHVLDRGTTEPVFLRWCNASVVVSCVGCRLTFVKLSV